MQPPQSPWQKNGRAQQKKQPLENCASVTTIASLSVRPNMVRLLGGNAGGDFQSLVQHPHPSIPRRAVRAICFGRFRRVTGGDRSGADSW